MVWAIGGLRRRLRRPGGTYQAVEVIARVTAVIAGVGRPGVAPRGPGGSREVRLRRAAGSPRAAALARAGRAPLSPRSHRRPAEASSASRAHSGRCAAVQAGRARRRAVVRSSTPGRRSTVHQPVRRRAPRCGRQTLRSKAPPRPVRCPRRSRRAGAATRRPRAGGAGGTSARRGRSNPHAVPGPGWAWRPRLS